jgi:hypothetical protein
MPALHPLTISQLLAVRASCEATIWGINALLQADEELKKSSAHGLLPFGQEDQEDQEPKPEGPETCPHPDQHRRIAPVMGKPSRQVCGLCRQEVK